MCQSYLAFYGFYPPVSGLTNRISLCLREWVRSQPKLSLVTPFKGCQPMWDYASSFLLPRSSGHSFLSTCQASLAKYVATWQLLWQTAREDILVIRGLHATSGEIYYLLQIPASHAWKVDFRMEQYFSVDSVKNSKHHMEIGFCEQIHLAAQLLRIFNIQLYFVSAPRWGYLQYSCLLSSHAHQTLWHW
jgi:hypothetical protein